MGYKRYASIVLLLLLALISGCASTPGGKARSKTARPGWVDDPGSEYPDELYIAAVASGDNEETARKNATARIALVFEADVNADETLVEEYFETDSATGGGLSRTSSLKKNLEISSRQKLRNLSVPKTWQDPQTRLHYALACLDRDQARVIYRAELQDLDRDVGNYLDHFLKAQGKLTQLAYLDKALTLAAERDMLAGQLSIISRGTEHYTPVNARSDLIRARTDLRDRLGIHAEFSDPQRVEFNTAIRDVLEAFGFRIVESGGDYALSGGLSMRQLEREGIYVGWHAELHLDRVSDGAEFITLGEDGREGHLSYPEAERRAEREATNRIRTLLDAKLTGYLESLLGDGD